MTRYDIRARLTMIFNDSELGGRLKPRDDLRRAVRDVNSVWRARNDSTLERAFAIFLEKGRGNGRHEFANAMAGDIDNDRHRHSIAQKFELTPNRGLVALVTGVINDYLPRERNPRSRSRSR